MEKRVFLAIFLSFGILMVYQTYILPPPVPVEPPVASQGTAPAPTPQANQPAVAPPGTPATTPATPAPATVVGDTSARDIVVETDAVRAVFTTEGAALKSWRLKRYYDARGEPLELVPEGLPEAYPRPFTLATDQDAVSAVLLTAKFRPSAEGPLSLGSAPGTLNPATMDPLRWDGTWPSAVRQRPRPGLWPA